MKNDEKMEIKNFEKGLKISENATPAELHDAVKSAYMDRARQIYFIWRKLKELYPDVDANRVVREGSFDFGVWQGEQIAKKLGTTDVGPKEVLLGQTSRGGWLVFNQNILELTEERAVKMFKSCPIAEAILELSGSIAVTKMFCREMMGNSDYGIVDPFKNVKLEFPTTVADGEGCGCEMIITRVKG